MTDERQIGDRLKELRSKLDVKQDVVASEIGISRARYSHYENNHVEPDIELINKLASYYNVTTDFLLGHELKDIDYMTDEEVDEELKEAQKEMQVWYKSEPKDKRLKLKMIRQMIKSFEENS